MAQTESEDPGTLFLRFGHGILAGNPCNLLQESNISFTVSMPT